MSPRSVLIVGATSGVGKALAREYAADGVRVLAAGRSPARVDATARDLHVRYRADVIPILFDALDPTSARRAAEAILAAGLPDELVFVLGDNGTPDAAYRPDEIARVHAVNFGGAAALLALLLPELSRRRGSALGFVGSVAGERGRRGNFVYASAKAALAVYAQGLRVLLHPAGVSVTTVLLGWVDSRLSYGLTPSALTLSATRAARAIRRSVQRRADVVYIPGFWRVVMWLVRAIPERIFKRLNLP